MNSHKDNEGHEVAVAYGAENRLLGVAISASSAPLREISFSYDGASRLTNIVYPNGVNSTFGYDAENRVTNYTHGAFVNHVITRDPRGFKTREDIYAGLIPNFTNGLRQTRTHNDADQLLTANDTVNQFDPNENVSENGKRVRKRKTCQSVIRTFSIRCY
jgi:uncharacterized protein RhaS with RHS repeats